MHSPPLSMLPKNPLQMVVSKDPELQTHKYNAILSSNLIPIPSTAYVLKSPDPRFEESEKFTFRIANYMSNNLDKSQRKVIRRLGGKQAFAATRFIYISLLILVKRTCQRLCGTRSSVQWIQFERRRRCCKCN